MLRARRLGLSNRKRKAFNQAIQSHVLELTRSRSADSIACYWPFNGEPDLTPLFRQLMAEGCELALPVISQHDECTMNFFPWRSDTVMLKNKYGIFEPKTSTPMPLSGFAMLLMPLVAYDRLGNRLGMGAGYYDRHLESLRHSELPLRVGIAYSLQEIDPIDKNNWDIPLHGIVNEQGWFTFVK